MAETYNVKMIDYEIYGGALVAVFANKDYIAAQAKVDESVQDLIHKAQSKQYEELGKNLQKLRAFIKDFDKVYWFGAGNYAVQLLSQLTAEELKSVKFIPIDSNKDIDGYMLVNCEAPVTHISALADIKADALVICSIQFIDEMLLALKENNITAENILMFR
jgi:hypothetical protein